MRRFYDWAPVWLLMMLYGLVVMTRFITSALCCAVAWNGYSTGESGYMVGIWLMMAVATLPDFRKSAD